MGQPEKVDTTPQIVVAVASDAVMNELRKMVIAEGYALIEEYVAEWLQAQLRAYRNKTRDADLKSIRPQY